MFPTRTAASRSSTSEWGELLGRQQHEAGTIVRPQIAGQPASGMVAGVQLGDLDSRWMAGRPRELGELDSLPLPFEDAVIAVDLREPLLTQLLGDTKVGCRRAAGNSRDLRRLQAIGNDKRVGDRSAQRSWR